MQINDIIILIIKTLIKTHLFIAIAASIVTLVAYIVTRKETEEDAELGTGDLRRILNNRMLLWMLVIPVWNLEFAVGMCVILYKMWKCKRLSKKIKKMN